MNLAKGLYRLARPFNALSGTLVVFLGGYVAGTGAWLHCTCKAPVIQRISFHPLDPRPSTHRGVADPQGRLGQAVAREEDVAPKAAVGESVGKGVEGGGTHGFGTVEGQADQDVVNAIDGGDTITSISIEGDASALLESQAARVEEWNKALG